MVFGRITGHPSLSDDSDMSATDVGERERLFADAIGDLGSGRRVDFTEEQQTFFDETVAAGGTGAPSEREYSFARDILADAEVPENRGVRSRFATGDLFDDLLPSRRGFGALLASLVGLAGVFVTVYVFGQLFDVQLG